MRGTKPQLPGNSWSWRSGNDPHIHDLIFDQPKTNLLQFYRSYLSGTPQGPLTQGESGKITKPYIILWGQRQARTFTAIQTYRTFK